MKVRSLIVIVLACILIGGFAAVSRAQSPCCLEVIYGPAHPPSHNWQYDPANPNAPNLMMQAQLCLVCPPGVFFTEIISGIQITPTATGGGNWATDVTGIRVGIDTNCDGSPDQIIVSHTGPLPPAGVLCDTTGNGAAISPQGCVCLTVEIRLRENAPCGATYSFTLDNILNASCQPITLCNPNLHLQSAVKTVVCGQPCCLEISPGPNMPANHNFACPPAGTPVQPNLMAQVRICNPCPTDQPIFGLKLKAQGTGNDLTGIQQVQLFLDADCDGKPDTTAPAATGVYNADDGTVDLCSSTPITVLTPPDPVGRNCACFLIYYVMKCPNPVPGTYGFKVQSALGPNCQPICQTNQPVASAIKTVDDNCCLDVAKGPHFPADHTFTCIPGTVNQPNFMAEFRICNPCNRDMCVYGLQLTPGGTGNPATGITAVVVSLDYDCDGKPEVVNTISGQYPAAGGPLNLCKSDGTPLFCLGPNRCVCVRVEYVMACPAVPGTYWFDLTGLLGADCKPLCAKPLPIRSAVKTVTGAPCCPDVALTSHHPADHTFTCPPQGPAQPNFMQHVTICNPCPTPLPLHGIVLQAFGSGNDLTGISGVSFRLDLNCDGVPDAAQPANLPTGTYSADDGTLSLCSPTPVTVLQPFQCICIGVYYQMKCPAVPGQYGFLLTDLLGANCQPICQLPGILPIKSAVKTVTPENCCLQISVGPKNPPTHTWWPGNPIRNSMFQFKVCNPCPTPARITCFRLKASGTGNDSNDILGVAIVRDTNCNGVADPGESWFGASGAYASDNGLLNIIGNVVIPGGTPASPQCECFLVQYFMKPSMNPQPPSGSTYCLTLANICATNAQTGADLCKKGLPLNSNCKIRCWKVGHAKTAIPYIPLCLPWKVITAVYPDRFYMQDVYGGTPGGLDDIDRSGVVPDRSAGIAVLYQGGGALSPGTIVDVSGHTENSGCEVVIVPDDVTVVGEMAPITPLAMNNRRSGGHAFGWQPGVLDKYSDVFSQETNNVGLYVRLFGTVTGSDGLGSFWINDGSDLVDGSTKPDGTALVGVKVNAQYAFALPAVGKTVEVTGILRAESQNGACIRVLYPTTATDIKQLAP